jgi:hypothetical protein
MQNGKTADPHTGGTKVTKSQLKWMQSDLRRWIISLTESYREPNAGNVVNDPKIKAEIERLEILIKMLRSLSPSDFSDSSTPKIESGIKIPALQPRDCHPRSKWTGILRQMKKGDSIFVPSHLMAAILASAYRINVITTRRLIGHKVRIWRTN